MIMYSILVIALSVILVSSADVDDTLYFKSGKIECPDGKQSCDDDSTCCQLPNDDWACCVFKNAQCCSDRLHCCPKGSVCDVSGKKCRSAIYNVTIPAVQMLNPSSDDGSRKNLVGLTCPDRSVCPNPGAACCRQYSNRYSCCNYPVNVCCDDGLHCCHVGTVCDPIYNVCIPYPSRTGPVSTPVPAELTVRSNTENENCRDGRTCCHNKLGKVGSCLLEDTEAVCCEDGQHCCPRGTVCDTQGQRCSVQPLQRPVSQWSAKGVTTNDRTLCPDGESTCQQNTTCCPVSANIWGCCPLPSAVCCRDMKHCCPAGTYCTTTGKCISTIQSSRIPWSSVNYDWWNYR